MSAAVDSTILLNSDSEEEFVPSPPKRGRRPRGRRGARSTANSSRPQSTRASTARSRRPQRSAARGNANVTVINVGDIDSDEDDTPRTLMPDIGAFSSGSIAETSTPIGLDALAKVLGVTDCSPSSQTSGTQGFGAACEFSQEGTSSALDSTFKSKDVSSGSQSIAATHFSTSHSHVNSASTSCSHSENDVSTSGQDNGSLPVSIAPAPKKTARRGLARKNAGLNTTTLDSFSTSKLPDFAVYSSIVPSVFSQGKSLNEVKEFSQSSTSETQSESENFSEAEKFPVKAAVTKSIYRENNSHDSKKVVKRIEEEEDEAEVLDACDNKDDEDSMLVIRSPSPPPEVNARPKLTGRRKKLNQKLSNALQTINNVKGKLEKLGKTTPKSKSRGRQADIMIVGEEEGIVKKDMVVKVRYLSTVHRINMNLDLTLHSLTSELSRLVRDVEEHELSLFLGEQVLDLSVTLRSVNLSVADILDCHHIKTSEGISSEDSINLVVQCRNNRTKTTIVAHKRQPLRFVIKQYAEQMGLDTNSLRLVFDGEDVDPKDTPSKLDMEDLDVVDVITR